MFFDAAALGQEPEGQQVPLPPVIDADVNGVNHGGANELIAALTGVVEIDDDNEPGPKNIPVPKSATTFSHPPFILGTQWVLFSQAGGSPKQPCKTLQSCRYNKK